MATFIITLFILFRSLLPLTFIDLLCVGIVFCIVIARLLRCLSSITRNSDIARSKETMDDNNSNVEEETDGKMSNAEYQKLRRKRILENEREDTLQKKLYEYSCSFNHRIFAPRTLFASFVDKVDDLQAKGDFVAIGKLINCHTKVDKVIYTACDREDPNDPSSGHLAVACKGHGMQGIVSLFLSFTCLLYLNYLFIYLLFIRYFSFILPVAKVFTDTGGGMDHLV